MQGTKQGSSRVSKQQEQEQQQSQRHRLNLTKVSVFLHTISQAGWNRFSSVYMLSHGFTPSQIGQVNFTSKIAKAFAQPLWGLLSDTTDDPLSTMIVSTILGTMILRNVKISIDAYDGLTRVGQRSDISNLTMWRTIRSAVTAASPAMDALALRLVEGTSEGYGNQRLWGSIAWGFAALSAGSILDWFGEGSIFVYTYLTNGLLVLFFLALGKTIPATTTTTTTTRNHHRDHDLERPKNINNKESQQSAATTTTTGVIMGRVCCGFVQNNTATRGGNNNNNYSYYIPIGMVLMHNLGYGIMMVLFDNILMLQLERDFGMSRSLQGTFTLVSIFSTLPVYHYSNKLRERIGHLGMMESSIIVAVIRLFLTRLVCSSSTSGISTGSEVKIVSSFGSMRANWLLLLQLLHGYHFAANWTASVELLDTLADRQRRSLMQFLLNMTYFTVGSGLGNFWFGFLYEQHGGQAAYSRGIMLCLVDFILIRALKMLYTVRSTLIAAELGRHPNDPDNF